MKKHAKHRQLVKSNQAQPPVATFNKKAILFYVSMMFASNTAHANPTGGEFAAGAGAISTLGNLTTVQQNTQRAIVNWQSFGTNAGEAVKFVQPSANAAILNRVVGNLPSNLNGLLEGNGRVYLINPNGIVLGQNGVINVNGGFVASTQNISDSAFMQGGALLFTGENTGNIQILGKIQSAQGDIVIIAPKTEIAAGAELKAGQSIQLIAANEVRLSNGKFTVTPKLGDAGQLTVAGTLEAAKVQLEAHNNNLGALAINTTGTIRANGTQTNPDGSVTIMAYGEGSNIKVNGNISAQNNDASQQGGRIIVGRNEETGELAKSADVSGARFTTNKGFVETSGDYLATTGTRVLAKDWLLDPYNITIKNSTTANTTPSNDSSTNTKNYDANNTGSVVYTNDIVSNLEAGTNVKVSTGSAGNEAGNIIVQDSIKVGAITGDKTSKLTLEANNGITFNNAQIYKTQANNSYTAGQLDVELIAKGNFTADSAGIYLSAGSGIDVNGSVKIDSTTQYTGGWNWTRSALAMQGGSSITGGSVDIKLNVNLASEARVFGLFAENGTRVKATSGDIKIDSTLGANAINSTSVYFGSGFGNAIDLSAQTDINIISNVLRTVAANKNKGVVITDTKVVAGRDFTVKSTVADSASNAIYTGNNSGQFFQADVKGALKLLANQGSISVTNLAASKPINANDITIDNTGKNLETGGMGQYTGAGNGITFAGNDNEVGLEAKNTITIIGAADSGPGVSTGSTKIKAAGTINIDGNSNTSNGVWANNIGSLQSTGGDIVINGTSKSSSGLSLTGAITSDTGSVSLTGKNTDSRNATPAVYINNTISAGTQIKVSADTPTTPTIAALQLAKLAKLQTNNEGSNVDITSNSISVASDSTIKASATGSTGVVTLKAFSNDRLININSTNAASNNNEFSVSQNLIDKITSGKLIIGSTDANSVKVSSAITTTKSGDLELRAKNNIDINAALKVGSQGVGNLTLNSADGQIRQNDQGIITANKLHVASNAGVALAAAVNQINQLTVNAGSLNFKNGKALSVGVSGGAPTDTAIETKNGASIITTVGDLTINQTISNASSGDVVVGAGVSKNAGDSTGGDVKTISGKTIANNGKTYIYSGKASSTGTLSYLDNSLAELYLDGTTTGKAQNADSGVAYGATITNGANTQVLFRERVNVSLQDYVSGATLNKIYGDPNTANGQSTALWTDMQGALKASNSSNGSSNQLTSTMQDENGQNITFHVSAATVIDDMTGTMQLQGSDYSTANYLKANNTANNNPNGYSYTVPISTGKYTFAFDLNNSAVKVVVDKLALTGSIATGHTTYGSQLEAGAVTLTNVQGSGLSADKVSAAGVSIDTTGKTSTSGNLKAGTHKDIQSVAGITGADADNYTFANVKGDYTVNQKAITTADIAAVTDAVYGTSKATGAVSLGDDVILGDKVAAANLATVKDGEKSGSGNLNAGSYKQTVDGGLTGASGADDSANYTFAGVTTNSANYVVNKKDASASAAGNTVFYNGQLQADTVTKKGFLGKDKVDIVGAGSGIAEGVYQSALKVNGGADAGNYNVTFENAPFTIKVNTPSAYRYTPSSADAVTLTPITFGFGVAGGATAAGGNVEGSCDAWSQRAGAGSVSVMSLLKPNYMGLRNAKTDNMDAMSGGQASGASVSEEANPCANAAQVERQAKL